jgi:hypothetical protein
MQSYADYHSKYPFLLTQNIMRPCVPLFVARVCHVVAMCVLFLFGACTTVPNSYNFEDGLISHWTMDKVPDSQRCMIEDTSINALNGECYGDSYFTEDRYGNSEKALRIRGNRSDQVVISHKPIFSSMGNTMTIALWINDEGNDGTANRDRGSYIISKGRDNEPDSWFLATRAFYAQQPDQPNVRREVKSGNGIISEQIMPRNKWIFVVAVLNNNSGKIYLDGKVWLDGPSHFQGNFKPDSNFAPIIIGQHHDKELGWSSKWTFPFKGALDDVRIWKRPLSNIEVRALYAAEKPTVWQEIVQSSVFKWSVGMLFYFTSLFGAFALGFYWGRKEERASQEMTIVEPMSLTKGGSLIHEAQTEEDIPMGVFKIPEKLSFDDARYYQQILETIQANMNHSLFGVDFLAKELNISRRTLERDTREFFGCTPTELIKQVKNS